jgi:hypothetical protein
VNKKAILERVLVDYEVDLMRWLLNCEFRLFGDTTRFADQPHQRPSGGRCGIAHPGKHRRGCPPRGRQGGRVARDRSAMA